MKNVLGTVLAIATLITTPVWGADMATKARATAAAPVPTWSWTGFYVGGNLGYGWGRVNTDTTLIDFNGPGIFPPNSNSDQLSGIVGGGQIGYNWQFSPSWVAGFEADWQLPMNEKASALLTPITVSFLQEPPPPILRRAFRGLARCADASATSLTICCSTPPAD
jgi:outer membrane immunogenic protein